MPDPCTEPGPWLALFSEPSQLKRALRDTMPDCTRLHPRVCVPTYINVHTDPVPAEAPWVCPDCPPERRRCCSTRKGLMTHAYKMHGYRTPARQYVAGSQCPVCLKQFASRAAAIEHLGHRAPRCTARMCELTPLTDQQLADIEGVGRAQKQAAHQR